MSITLEDLVSNKNKSYRFLMDNSYHIETQYKDILYHFLGKVIEGHPSCMGDYTICPEWGEASEDFRMRFIIVKSDRDYSLVILKVVTPFTENYFRIDYPIISLYNENTSSKVLDVLKMYKDIHFYSVISEKRDGRRYNYYNTLEDFKSKMDKSKWKSKKGINKLSKIIDVQYKYDYASLSDIEGKIPNLIKEWNKARPFELSARHDMNLLDMYKRTDDIEVFTFWYKNVLVAYSIGVRMFSYIVLLSTKTIAVCGEEKIKIILGNDGIDESTIRNIKKHLGAYTQYYLHKILLEDLKYNALFYYGDSGLKKLHSFKEEYYRNRIDYKFYSCEGE